MGGKGFEWAPVGKGIIDWTGQFKALKQAGYTLGVSLETHWNGGGTPEESSQAELGGNEGRLTESRSTLMTKTKIGRYRPQGISRDGSGRGRIGCASLFPRAGSERSRSHWTHRRRGPGTASAERCS